MATIRLINGLISCWKCLKFGHWGRNLSSIVSRLCNTLSSKKTFGSCCALTTVSFSRQRSSMLCSGLSFAKTIYLQNNDDMREGRNKLEENTLIENISETAAVASTVLPLNANFFPLSPSLVLFLPPWSHFSLITFEACKCGRLVKRPMTQAYSHCCCALRGNGWRHFLFWLATQFYLSLSTSRLE